MDLQMLSRFQFGLTVGFHYIFPPLSIGLGLMLVFMEGLYLKTRKPLYHQMTRFWVKIFGLIFALGVATGIVMEFQFGTNWSTYSRFVGDVFGSALAAEGIFAFFLESGFLAILLFGWDKVSARMHFISTILVCVGAHFSAVWIVVANSWQQTPAGFHIVGQLPNVRAEMTSFWNLVFNPSTVDRIWHVYMGAWQAGAFFVLSVSAYYILKNKHIDFAKASFRIALVVAAVSSLLQLVSGDVSGKGVARNQPAKMAAFEGLYDTGPADAYLFGWVDEDQEKVQLGIRIPGLLSYLIHGDTQKPVTGLKEFQPEDRPPVNIVFQTYHAMVAIGCGLILLSWLGLFLWWRKSLFGIRWLLWVFVFSVLGPELANQLGWVSAEVGRQPWIVYNFLRTSEGLSKVVHSGDVLISIILFSLVYLLLLALFIYLLNHKIQGGPDAEDLDIARQRA
jgi:cytochrome bd ubiquinol oxidase subunit I